MRKPTLVIAAVALLAAALGCGSTAPLQVKAQFDDSASYSSMRSFRWLPSGATGGSATVRETVKQAVEDELTGRGYTLAQDGRPDFWVNVHIGIAQRIDMTNIGYGFRPGVEPMGSPPTAALTRGSIMVDVLDPDSRELLWRGVASGLKTSPVTARRLVPEAVRAILAEFPPLA